MTSAQTRDRHENRIAPARRIFVAPRQGGLPCRVAAPITGDPSSSLAMLPMPPTITAQYAALVAAGEIERDPAQERAVARLASLNEQLAMHRLARKSSSLGWLFGQRGERRAESPKGLYLWGEVGRGKTMLMDMFFAACPVRRKRRAHFHQFMLDVQDASQRLSPEAQIRRNLRLGPDPPDGGRPRRGGAGALLRRIPCHRHRRRR